MFISAVFIALRQLSFKDKQYKPDTEDSSTPEPSKCVGGTPAKMRHDERHGRWRRVKPSPRPVFRPVVIDLLLRSLFETGLGPNLCLLRVF